MTVIKSTKSSAKDEKQGTPPSCKIKNPVEQNGGVEIPVQIIDASHRPFSSLNVRGQKFFMVPHCAKFAVFVKNPFHNEKCSFNLSIDGLNMGSWILKPGSSGYFERPVKINQRFTFMSTPLVSRAEEAADVVSNDISAIYSPEIQKALFNAPLGTGIKETNAMNGQVQCTFTPELKGHGSNVKIEHLFGKYKRDDCSKNEIVQSKSIKKLGKHNSHHKNKDDDIIQKSSKEKSYSSSRPSSAKREDVRFETGSEKMKSSQRKRCSSFSGPPSTSAHPILTPGASTLQGPSSQKFGKSSLKKDHSRAVSFVVYLVAAVPQHLGETIPLNMSSIDANTQPPTPLSNMNISA